MSDAYLDFYRGRRVMITGGLGFIGSNLARRLVELDADILLVDSLIDDYGGNLFNLAGVEGRVRVNIADVRQPSTMNYLVRDREVIFNLAGQVSHIDSMRDPVQRPRDQLPQPADGARGVPALQPVDEGGVRGHAPGVRQARAPAGRTKTICVRPTDVNGINKIAGEFYHLVYNNVFGVRACSLRLTNVYGPRQLLRHSRQGFIGWFIRLAIEGREIQVFGDGLQLRDFVYVDDAADAFLRAGAADVSNGEFFNVGGAQPISHSELVTLLIEIAGSGTYRLVDWPADKKAIDIGSFFADSSRIKATLGWEPRVVAARGPGPHRRLLPLVFRQVPSREQPSRSSR